VCVFRTEYLACLPAQITGQTIPLHLERPLINRFLLNPAATSPQTSNPNPRAKILPRGPPGSPLASPYGPHPCPAAAHQVPDAAARGLLQSGEELAGAVAGCG
jgi:hypothetical protein